MNIPLRHSVGITLPLAPRPVISGRFSMLNHAFGSLLSRWRSEIVKTQSVSSESRCLRKILGNGFMQFFKSPWRLPQNTGGRFAISFQESEFRKVSARIPDHQFDNAVAHSRDI